MTIEREVEVIHARLDEQGRLITQHGDRLNIHATRMDELMLVVFGDDEKEIKGLLQRTSENEKILAEISQWRRDMRTATKIGLALLGATGLGTWLQFAKVMLDAMGG